MKTFELEKMGVQEMDAIELKEKNGGGLLVGLLLVLAAAAIADGMSDGQEDKENAN